MKFLTDVGIYKEAQNVDTRPRSQKLIFGNETSRHVLTLTVSALVQISAKFV